MLLNDDGTFVLGVTTSNLGIRDITSIEVPRKACKESGLQFIIPNNEEIFDFIKTKFGVMTGKLIRLCLLKV